LRLHARAVPKLVTYRSVCDAGQCSFVAIICLAD
jgi:hypothetical protein